MSATLPPDFLSPLETLYEHAGRTMPEIHTLGAAELPLPYRVLLAHSGDMTSKLEEFYGDNLRLRILARELRGEVYLREVLLCTETTGKVVEYGAIQIQLAAFDETLRNEIIEGTHPLGAILNRHQTRYRSQPRAFLSVEADARLCEFFTQPPQTPLFGRSNVLLDENGATLAEIVEILHVPVQATENKEAGNS